MNTNKKTLKFFFNTIYSHGKLIDLIIPFNNVKKIDLMYKENFNKFSTFKDFENSFPIEFENVKKSKSAYQEIKKQFNSKNGLQPCILTECFVAQTLANHLNLNQYIDLDEEEKVPSKLTGVIYSAKGYNDGSKFRYCYYNDQVDALVFQCGASGTVDIVFIKFNMSIRIEVKEQISKLEECDITGLYNENGFLQLNDDFKIRRSKYIPFIQLFNMTTNIFELEGHNFNFCKYLNDDKIKSIIDETLNTKVVDLFILVVGDKLVPTLSKNLFEFVTFEGSEIRTAGRNYKKNIFTPSFARKKLISMGAEFTNELVIIPFDPSLRVKGRNKNVYNRYKLGSLLFVKLEDCNINNNFISFKFDKICQKIPSISIHLNARINSNSLLKQYFELCDL